MHTESVVRAPADPLPDVWLTMWHRLPLVAAMDALVCLAIAPVLGLVLIGWWLPAFACAIGLVGPVWVACVAVSDELVRRGDEANAGVANLLRGVVVHARSGIAVTVVPVTVAGLTCLTLRLRAAAPDESWLLASLAVDLVVLGPVAAATLPAFSLRVNGGLRGHVLWRSALAVIASSPLQVTGLAAVCVLVWVLSGLVGNGLWFLLPGPLVLLASGTTWLAVARASAR